MKERKGFTLAELITAVAILAMLAGFVSVIFKSSIDGYRSAGANTEIMQKFRAITEQLNSDFEGFCKDGFLKIQKDFYEKRDVYEDKPYTEDVYMDKIYYFTTGDFQSWFDPSVKSNIARVFWGHESDFFGKNLSECRLVRDVLLLTPTSNPLIDELPDDCNGWSFSQCKADLSRLDDVDVLFKESIDLSDANNFRSFMCENIGEFKIDRTDGYINSAGLIVWDSNDGAWGPNSQKPKALKFTFTLYDSKGILDGGRRFTHIVYLDN